MKAGSPDPVMTRQLWLAVALPTLSTAAGVAVARVVARATQPPTTTAAASQRVERSLRRIGCPFSPGVGRFICEIGWAENVSGTVYHDFWVEVKPSNGPQSAQFAGVRE